jgi:hypothetical protein
MLALCKQKRNLSTNSANIKIIIIIYQTNEQTNEQNNSDCFKLNQIIIN